MTDPMVFAFEQSSIQVTTPTWAALMHVLRDRLLRREGFAVATINLDHLVKLRTDARFREVYEQHDIVVADGNPIVWLSRLAGRPVELVPGSDLIKPLAGLAAELGVPVALFGSTPEVLHMASDTLCREHPALKIACTIAPPMSFEPTGTDAQRLLADIRASGARLCLVAMGAPKQETFAALGRQLVPECGFVSIGAGLDFLGGTQRRAPRVMRMLALEWAWRMMSDPRRLAVRYLRCALILPGQAMAAFRLRRLRG